MYFDQYIKDQYIKDQAEEFKKWNFNRIFGKKEKSIICIILFFY